MAAKKTASSDTIHVQTIKEGRVEVYIKGKTPLIIYRLSQKAAGELLLPKGRKTAAEKKTSLKHNPIQEFRDSPYTIPDGEAHLAMPVESFKNSLRYAAVDISGATKAEIGRLVYMEGKMVPIFGEPKLFMHVVRSSDMNRTPDIRTRCIVPEWCCKLTIRFIKPQINDTVIANLLGAAGLIQGLGDWRPQKGSGNYGQYEIVSEKDEDWHRIAGEQGFDVQKAAMAKADPYDAESEEMLGWFNDEVERRGLEVVK